MRRLPYEFYHRPCDIVARDLVGKVIIHGDIRLRISETEVYWGENDTATPLSDAKQMEREIPNAGLAVIKGAGHYSFLEQPDLFLRIMASFFEIG